MIGLSYFIYFLFSWFVLTTIEVVMTKRSHRQADFNRIKLVWLSAVLMIAPAVTVPIIPWFHHVMFGVYVVVLLVADGYVKPKLLPWALKDWQLKTKMLSCLHK